MKTLLIDAVSAYLFTIVSRFGSGFAIAISLLLGIASQSAQGAPVQLNAVDFANQISGLGILVEDFEGFPLGDQPSPLTLANATYTSSRPYIVEDLGLPTRSLINNEPDPDTGRVFDAFATGTTMFGLDLNDLGFGDDVLRITVVGTSGTLTVEQTTGSLGDFIGFQDALGLTSVTFFNLGYGGGSYNYGFDNVTTGIVPIPAAVWLLASGLLGIIGMGRRNKV
jgi:hypothetical protein